MNNMEFNYTLGIYAEGYLVFVFLFVHLYVRSSVMLTKITSKFCVKVSRMGISQQPLIRKHSYLGHGYLGGSAYISWFLAPGSMPRGGAEDQNLGHPEKVLYCFFFYAKPFSRHYVRHQSSLWPSLSCHEVKVRVTYISWLNDFALYLENYLMDECHTWYNGSVWLKDWPHKIYVGQRPIFHGPVILPYILKTIWWMKATLDIMDQCDTKIDHIKYI